MPLKILGKFYSFTISTFTVQRNPRIANAKHRGDPSAPKCSTKQNGRRSSYLIGSGFGVYAPRISLDLACLWSTKEVNHCFFYFSENNMNQSILICPGFMETIELQSKVDIILSEWMGYFLLYEAMLSSVIVARDKYLKPGGLIFPNVARILMCAVDDKGEQNLHYVYDYYSVIIYKSYIMHGISIS